jgi:hypothetical protein
MAKKTIADNLIADKIKELFGSKVSFTFANGRKATLTPISFTEVNEEDCVKMEEFVSVPYRLSKIIEVVAV